MALVSWHRLRSCASIDLAVAFDFTSQYSFPTAEDRSTRASRPNPGPRSGDRGDPMAKKKKRPRYPASERPQAPRGGANLERRDRKEEARRLREAERRRARRAASLRRTLTSAGIAVAVAAISLFRSFQGPNEIPEGAVQAASEAGCTTPSTGPT